MTAIARTRPAAVAPADPDPDPREKVLASRKPVFTTGQIATLTGAAPRTVSKWIDKGYLKGFRIPGGLDRRVSREHLVTFLREMGLDREADRLDPRPPRVLVVGAGAALLAAVRAAAPRGVEVRSADEAAAAGAELAHWRPALLLADASVGRSAVRALAGAADRHAPGCRRVLVAGPDLSALDGWEVLGDDLPPGAVAAAGMRALAAGPAE